MEIFPTEIYCKIFEHLTDPVQIARLFQSDEYLADIARNCITTLKWANNSRQRIHADFVLGFQNITEVLVPINVETKEQFYALSKLPRLRIISINYYQLKIFNPRVNSDEFSSGIKSIIHWYEMKTPIQNKNISFYGGQYDITIQDNTLLWNMGTRATYSIMDPLMKAIDQKEGLTSISDINPTESDIQTLGILYPRLQSIVINDSVELINKYFKYSNINRVQIRLAQSFSQRRLLSKLAFHMSMLITPMRGRRIETITKSVYLEVPIYIDDVDKLIRIYPNVKLISLYLVEPYADQKEIQRILDRTADDVNILIYSSKDAIRGIFLDDPRVNYHLID